MILFSLDISSVSTGWSITDCKGNYIVGTITTCAKATQASRLFEFKIKLIKILRKYSPNFCVQEEVFVGSNAKVSRILSEFSGVAKEVIYEYMQSDTIIINNRTVKSFFKAKTKEVLFDFAKSLLTSTKKTLHFKKDNDIIDSVMQSIYYLDISGLYVYRESKSYGFQYGLYEVIINYDEEENY